MPLLTRNWSCWLEESRLRSFRAPAIAEGYKRYEWHKGRYSVATNLKASRTSDAFTNPTTP